MVGIYVRLSDEDTNKKNVTDESESIQNQKLMLRDYCVERGWEIYDLYVDEDYSGTNFNRPDFQRLLKDCENGKIKTVLCKSQSRFSRDMSVIETYLHDKFPEWGVRFVSIIDRADTKDVSNKKARQINGLINEWYCEEVSDNVRKVLQNKRQNGQFTGSFAPYGYLVDPENKNHLIIDENVAPVVKNVYEWYLQGQGYRKIVIKLNELGIPNPSAYKKQQNSNYVNKKADESPSKSLWTHTTIYSMIRNEVYTGSLVQGKSHSVSYKNKKRKRVDKEDWIRVRDCHEAIIDEKTYFEVQKRLKSKLRVGGKSGELSPLSGKVKCAHCGRPMKRNIYYNKKRTITYYSLVCATYKIGAMNCSNKSSISGKIIEKTIVDEINALIKNYCDFDVIKIKNTYQEKINSLKSFIFQNEEEIKTIQNKMLSLYEDKLENLLSKENYLLFNQKYESEILELNIKNEKLKMQLKEINSKTQDVENRQEIFEKYLDFDTLNREIVEEFIDSVEVYEKSGSNPHQIKINWNF